MQNVFAKYGLEDPTASPDEEDVFAKYGLEAPTPTITGEFVKGVKSGVDATQQGLYGLTSLAARAANLPAVEQWSDEGVARNEAEMQANAPAVPSIQDIGGVRDAALWASAGLGQLAPFMATSVASGGVGGIAGRALAAGAAKRAVGEAAKRAVLNKAIQTGAIAGAGLNSMGFETGSIYGDQISQGGEREPLKALGYGAVAGALDVLPEMRIIRKVLGTAQKAGVKPVGVIRDVLTQMGLEGSTEAAQTVLERMGANRLPFSEEGIWEAINAGALGALGGGVMGGGARAYQALRGQPDQPVPLAERARLLAPGQIAIRTPSGDIIPDAAAQYEAMARADAVETARRAEEQRLAELSAAGVDTGRPGPLTAAVAPIEPVAPGLGVPVAPWQQTRGEFAASAVYQGINANTTAGNPSYWFTDQPDEAAMFAQGDRGTGEQGTGQTRIDIAMRGDLGVDGAPSERPSGSTHWYTGAAKTRPVVASIPISAAADPHRFLVEQALASGADVPANVLAEYPDLAAKYGTPVGAPLVPTAGRRGMSDVAAAVNAADKDVAFARTEQAEQARRQRELDAIQAEGRPAREFYDAEVAAKMAPEAPDVVESPVTNKVYPNTTLGQAMRRAEEARALRATGGPLARAAAESVESGAADQIQAEQAAQQPNPEAEAQQAASELAAQEQADEQKAAQERLNQATKAAAKADQAERKRAEAAAAAARSPTSAAPTRAMNRYTVDTEDSGAFGVRVLRQPDGSVAIFPDDGGNTIEYNAEFGKGKSDAELLRYSFEPLGFKGATDVETATHIAALDRSIAEAQQQADTLRATGNEAGAAALDRQVEGMRGGQEAIAKPAPAVAPEETSPGGVASELGQSTAQSAPTVRPSQPPSPIIGQAEPVPKPRQVVTDADRAAIRESRDARRTAESLQQAIASAVAQEAQQQPPPGTPTLRPHVEGLIALNRKYAGKGDKLRDAIVRATAIFKGERPATNMEAVWLRGQARKFEQAKDKPSADALMALSEAVKTAAKAVSEPRQQINPQSIAQAGTETKAPEADPYAAKLAEWDAYTKKWGRAKALERAQNAVAGGILGREFGESAESFYARSPRHRATRDWLQQQRDGEKAPDTPALAAASPNAAPQGKAGEAKKPWEMSPAEYAASVDKPIGGDTRMEHVAAIKEAHAAGKAIPAAVLNAYPVLRDKLTPTPRAAAPSGKPDPGRYTQPGNTSSPEAQKELANRGSRVATAQMLNEFVAKTNPGAAYSRDQIDGATNLDAMTDWLVSQGKAQTPPPSVAPAPPPQPQAQSAEKVSPMAERVAKGSAERAGVVAPVAQHIEGKTTEPATAPVVAKALAKGGDLRAARAAAVEEVKAAIAKAPTLESTGFVRSQFGSRNAQWTKKNPDYGRALKDGEAPSAKTGGQFVNTTNEWIEATQDDINKAIGYVTIKVPGDGKFRILNTKENLQAFADKLAKAPGFTREKVRTNDQVFGKPGANTTFDSTMNDLWADREYLAAIELAVNSDRSLVFGNNDKVAEGGMPPVYTRATPVEMQKGVDTVVAKQMSSDGSGKWRVIEKTTGLSLGEGKNQFDAVVKAKQNAKGKDIKAEIAKVRDKPGQEKLEAAFRAWAEKHDVGAEPGTAAIAEAEAAKEEEAPAAPKSADDNLAGQGGVLPDEGGPLYSLADNPQIDTPAFKAWFGESKVVGADGKPLRVYHGAARPDRVGTVFRKSRATSGPMAFFSDDPTIASSYAQGKADTSLADENQNYETWYKYKPPGSRSAVDIDRAWWFLTPEQRTKIAELAPQISRGRDGERIQIEPGNKTGLGGYDQHIKEARGNHLKALVEEWLSSAALFNEEESFAEVLKLAGMPMDRVEYSNPQDTYPAVYPVYLAIERPLVTNAVPERVYTALELASRRQRAPRPELGDMWSKTARDPKEWIGALKDDLQAGKNSYAWTSIPDWVTRTLRNLGYDGIHDTGGKGGGQEHDVWIPFEETQVKSASGNRGTFDPANRNILRSLGEGRPTLAEAWRAVSERDDVFRYPISKSKDLRTIIKEVAPGFEVGETISDNEYESGTKVWPKDHPDRVAYVIVYRQPRRVILNVYNMKEGDGGMALYAAVGNYAENNGMKFHGDTMGMTEVAEKRRLEYSISHALKYRNVSSVLLYRNYELGAEKLGLNGDYDHDLGVMLEQSYKNVKEAVPGIDTATMADVPALVKQARNAGFPVGESTIRRAIITAQVKQRGMDALADFTDADTKGILYRTGKPTTGTTAADVEGWVRPLLRQLPNAPRLVVTQRPPTATPGARGEYNPATNTATLYADNLKDEAAAIKTFLHETVGHAGLRGVFGDKLDAILDRIYATNPEIRKLADAQIELAARHGKRYSKTLATEEALSNMAGEGRHNEITGWKALVAAIRDLLRKMGIDVDFSENDVIAMLARSHEYLARRKGVAPRTVGRAEPAYSEQAGPFYSALASALRTKAPFAKDGTIPPAQLRMWLDARAKDGTIKADELQWSGLGDWLATQTGKVRRDDVAAFLDANGVKVEEVVLGEPVSQPKRRVFYARTIDNQHDPVQMEARQSVEDPQSSYRKLVERGDARWQDENGQALSSEDAATIAEQWEQYWDRRRRENEEDADGLDRDGTKFGQWQLPGGQNYRELLLTLPVNQNKAAEARSARTKELIVQRDELDRRIDAATPADDVRDLMRQRRNTDTQIDMVMRETDDRTAFRSSHFDQPNVLAHVRFNERTDADGKRVLFIEEIQSDWAQKGRKEGFASITPSKAEVRNGQWGVVDPSGAFWRYPNREEAERVAATSARTGPPSAPFVGKTEAWVALAMKRMIRYGAEHGFDAVAWTNGEQQADRYDLSKHVASIVWRAAKREDFTATGSILPTSFKGDEKKVIMRLHTGERDIHLIVQPSGNIHSTNERMLTGKPLDDAVGKDIAKRILDAPTGDMRGLDLKVGGEGMRAFYDKIVPNVANDILKKLGGGRVGTVDISGHAEPSGTYNQTRVRREGQEYIAEGFVNNMGWQYVGEYPTRLEAEQAIAQSAQPQPGFSITPAMREAAMAGQPLFSIAPQTDTAAFRKWFGNSKVVDENGAPLVVYHGTARDFAEFSKDVESAHIPLPGFYFSPEAEVASRFATSTVPGRKALYDADGYFVGVEGSNVMPVYLSMQNPLYEDVGKGARKGFYSEREIKALIEEAKRLGHDGVILRGWKDGSGPVQYIAFRPEQIKSATGNVGTFDAANPDIRYSLAPDDETQKALADSPAAKAAKKFDPKALKNSIVRALEMNPLGKLPEQEVYLTKRGLTLGKLADIQSVTRDLYAAFREAGDNAPDVYQYLTTKDAQPSIIKDAGLREQAVKAKETLIGVGQKLVDHGLLAPEVFEAHRGEYLPRIYLMHLLGDDAITALSTGKRPSDLGYLKARKDIPEPVRRLIMGEITDPAYLVSKAYGTQMRDIALLDWLEQIAGTKEWVLPNSLVKWEGKNVTPMWLKQTAKRIRAQALHYTEQNRTEARAIADKMDETADATLEQYEGVPDGWKQMPDTARYGRLRGLIVKAEIYDDIVGSIRINPDDMSVAEKILGNGGYATKFTQLWKWSKVAANPPAQVRNFVSNGVLLHLSGVPFHMVLPRIIHAIREVRTNGEYWKVAKKYGVTESTFAAQELFRIEREFLDLQARGATPLSIATAKNLAGKFMDFTGDVYQLSEALFKTAKIIDEMKKGKTEAQAAMSAQQALFDYSLVTPSMRYLRNAPIGAPFITFYFKVLPRLLDVAMHHPLRFAPYVAIPYALTAMLASMADVDDDDVDKLKLALPEWLRERSNAYFLPMKDDKGRWMAMDIGYFLPWTTWQELGGALAEGEFGKAMKTSGLLGGPVPDMLAAIKTNKNAFTGKTIVNEFDPPAKQLASIMGYLWSMSMPTWLTNYGFAGHMYNALNETVDKHGEVKDTVGQATMRMFGVNLYPINPEQSRADNLRRMRYEIEEEKRRRTMAIRDRNLTPEDRAKAAKEYNELIAKRMQDMAKYAQDSRVHPNLRTGVPQ